MVERTASAVKWAQAFVAPAARPGSICVDATAGHGRDTLFLARLVGDEGLVYAFDIQEEALRSTAELLNREGLAHRVRLLHAGHEDMARYVPYGVSAVLFNLGYLPGGDHRIITRAVNTVRALRAACALLRPGGRIALVIYTGHPGAKEEQAAVENETRGLNPRLFHVLRLTFWNRQMDAPVLIFIERQENELEGRASEKNTGDNSQ